MVPGFRDPRKRPANEPDQLVDIDVTHATRTEDGSHQIKSIKAEPVDLIDDGQNETNLQSNSNTSMSKDQRADYLKALAEIDELKKENEQLRQQTDELEQQRQHWERLHLDSLAAHNKTLKDAKVSWCHECSELLKPAMPKEEQICQGCKLFQ